MRKRVFMIPSLLAAGFFPQKAGAVTPGIFVDRKDPKPTLFERFRLQHKYTLAGHRSHSSHSSHSSHRSSSGGGYSTRSYSAPSAPIYQAPSPTYEPTYRAPTSPSYGIPSQSTTSPSPSMQPLYGAPSQPAGTSSTTSVAPRPLPGNSDKFKRIVMQVQMALTAYGYYSGVIDGLVGGQTRTALTSMQTDYGLKATGTITPQTLDALRIVAE